MIADDADEVFAAADMIVKVKEPQPAEIARLREGQILFTYLHLAADRAQTEGLMRSGAICIAYETVTDARGALPLLAPMSEVAGRMSVQVGAHCLEKEQGGAGILLGGVPGVRAGARRGAGRRRLRHQRRAHGDRARGERRRHRPLAAPAEASSTCSSARGCTTLYATADAIEREVLDADLVIGAVLVPGAAAPKLVSARWCGGCGPARCWWTSRSTRAAASRPAGRPRMPTRPMSRRASCITA